MVCFRRAGKGLSWFLSLSARKWALGLLCPAPGTVLEVLVCLWVSKTTWRLLGSDEGGRDWWMRASPWMDCPSLFHIYLFIFYCPLWPLWKLVEEYREDLGMCCRELCLGLKSLGTAENKTKWKHQVALPVQMSIKGGLETQAHRCSVTALKTGRGWPRLTSLLMDWEAKTEDVPGKLVFCCHPSAHGCLAFHLRCLLNLQPPSSHSWHSTHLLYFLAWPSYITSGQMEPSTFQSPFRKFYPHQRRLAAWTPCDKEGEWGS